MKKRKLASLVVIAALSVGSLCIPAMAEELQDATTVPNQIQEIESTTTTGSAIEIKDFLTPEDLENENLKVTKLDGEEAENLEVIKLEAEIKDDALIGNKITAKVRGYNKENKEIKLNEKDINYKWIAKDKIAGTEKIIGTEKKLEITDDMNKLEIHCDVSYENQ
ncbi:UNVERIFIED_ORG: hypothetical protein B2H98_08085 [Clostridium botulinum]